MAPRVMANRVQGTRRLNAVPRRVALITKGACMNRPILTLPPKVKTLAQQNTDFTAEGSPPPGNVGAAIPDTAGTTAQAAKRMPRIPAAVTRAHKRPPWSKGA